MVFKKILLTLLAVLQLLALTGQKIEWQKSFGGSEDDIPKSVIATADGGFIIAGYSNSSDGDVTTNRGGSDYWIVKFNSNGNLKWQSSFGGSSKHDYANDIIQNLKGDYVIAGSSFSKDGDINEKDNRGNDDFWIIYLDEEGGKKWSRNFGGSKKDIAYSIVQTDDEGYLVAGSTESQDKDVEGNHGLRDMWIVKTAKSGKMIWQKCIGGSGNDMAYSVKKTTDGGYIIAGETNSTDGDIEKNNGNYDFMVVKLTAIGDIQWVKCLGGTESEIANDVIQNKDGGYIVVGETQSSDGDVTSNSGAIDCWVVKLSPKGAIEWQHTYGGLSFDYGREVISRADNGYFIIGATNSNYISDTVVNYGGIDSWIVKLENSGEAVWQKNLGGSFTDEAASVTILKDKSVIVVNNSTSNDHNLTEEQTKGGSDYWIVRINDE